VRQHVARRKEKSGRVSVFKGRQARLNRAIFHILALKGPQTIWDLTKEVKQQKFLRRKLYSVISRRVRTLEQQGYVEKVGTRKTLAGGTGTLYQLTSRAYLATLLNQTNLDWLIQKAWETDVLDLLAILAKYLKD
jgi:DNA-binding HxlR family transcriptional regulator